VWRDRAAPAARGCGAPGAAPATRARRPPRCPPRRADRHRAADRSRSLALFVRIRR
jgi:hypothetical protein